MTAPPAVIAAALDLVVPFVAACESCRLSAYLPTPRDRPTIGYGATYHRDGTPVRLGDVTTAAEASAQLRDTLGHVAGAVAALAGAATSPCQLAAMTSLAFNIGMGGGGDDGFRESTVLRRHLAGDHAGAAAAFALWNKQDGVVLAGLVNRRRREAALYLGAKP